jgi:hypothetical protein
VVLKWYGLKTADLAKENDDRAAADRAVAEAASAVREVILKDLHAWQQSVREYQVAIDLIDQARAPQ